MQSEGRRAFLRGRRVPASPWENFCSRLRNAAAGEVTILDSTDHQQAARLRVKQPADIHHARRLCSQHGVSMALEGVPGAAVPPGPVLWVRPGHELSACRRMKPDSSRWFVQPGCLLGELEAAGLSCFADMPAHLTVAAWLADRRHCNWPTGGLAASGVVHASVMLADGGSVSLGAFGTDNRKALDSLRLQQLVPALFRLASGADGRVCAERRIWPARYRLDALLPAPGKTLNLAHLLLGHGGDLGWFEWVVMDATEADPVAGSALPLELPGCDFSVAGKDMGWPGAGEPGGGTGPCDDVNLARAAQDLDGAVKSLFDPDGLFPHPGQALYGY